MKQLKNVMAIIALLFMVLGMSSCYIGVYHPGPRYGAGARFRPVGPRYHHPPRHYHRPPYHGPRGWR